MRRIRFIDAFSTGSRQDSRPVVHVLRDRTRSGVASALIEIAQTAKVGMLLDPLYVANEGEFLAIVVSEDVDFALKALSSHSLGKDALYRIARRCDESSTENHLRGRIPLSAEFPADLVSLNFSQAQWRTGAVAAIVTIGRPQ